MFYQQIELNIDDFLFTSHLPFHLNKINDGYTSQARKIIKIICYLDSALVVGNKIHPFSCFLSLSISII